MVTTGGHSFLLPAGKPHPLNGTNDPEDLLPPQEYHDHHSCGYPYMCGVGVWGEGVGCGGEGVGCGDEGVGCGVG